MATRIAESQVTLGLSGSRLAQGSLRCGKPCDRHAERGARHVVEADLVAERDRSRIAAMLAANADLELAARLAPPFDADAHQFADALLVNGDKGIAGNDAALRVNPK